MSNSNNGASLANKSVKADDYRFDPSGGYVSPVNVITSPLDFGGSYAGLNSLKTLPPAPPDYWSHWRDLVLRNTVFHAPLWASAVHMASTQQAAQRWDIKGGPTQKKRAQALLNNFGFGVAGWHSDLMKGLRDYWTTDNGQFILILREAKSRASRIVGLAHLDSLRCTRTGDLDTPVLYRDKQGNEHELKAWQVITLVDMPDPGEGFNGVGLCAASRAYRAIRTLAATESFVEQKVSGRKPLAIDLVQGLQTQTLTDAIKAAQLTANQQEQSELRAISYMGSILMGLIGQAVSHVRINLAELPDGFQRLEEFNINLYLIADSLGLDFQDLAPLSGGPLGSGQQSQVLDDKARGRAGALWREQFLSAINWQVLPDLVTFEFIENDYRDRLQEAEIKTKTADYAGKLVESGMLTAQQGLQYMASKDPDLVSFVPEALQSTSDGLGNLEKEQVPDEQTTTIENNQSNTQAQDPTVAAKADGHTEDRTIGTNAGIVQTLKADDDLDAAIDAELADALDWAQKVSEQ
jgi:hypothetical protein